MKTVTDVNTVNQQIKMPNPKSKGIGELTLLDFLKQQGNSLSRSSRQFFDLSFITTLSCWLLSFFIHKIIVYNYYVIKSFFLSTMWKSMNFFRKIWIPFVRLIHYTVNIFIWRSLYEWFSSLRTVDVQQITDAVMQFYYLDHSSSLLLWKWVFLRKQQRMRMQWQRRRVSCWLILLLLFCGGYNGSGNGCGGIF